MTAMYRSMHGIVAYAGSVAVACVHVAFQWLGIMSAPPKPSRRTQGTGSGGVASPLGFPADQQRNPQPQYVLTRCHAVCIHK